MKKRNLHFICIIYVVFTIFITSCDTSADMISSKDASISITLSRSGEETPLPSIKDFTGYHFTDSILSEIIPDIHPDGNNSFTLRPEVLEGYLFLSVNTNDLMAESKLTTGVTTLREFLSIKADTAAMLSDGGIFTGEAKLHNSVPAINVEMKRPLARIDIDTHYSGIEVHSVTVKNVVLKGSVFGEPANDISDETTDLVRSFSTTPLRNTTATLFHLPAQYGNNIPVEIMITNTGSWHRLRTVIPRIERNQIYTLKVYGFGDSFRVSVSSAGWEEGTGAGSIITPQAIFYPDESVLSDAVSFSPNLDTVFVEPWHNTFSLALKAGSGTEFSIDGRVEAVEVNISQSRGLSTSPYTINVISLRKMPGVKEQYMHVNAHIGDVLQGRLVIVFRPNPITIDGRISFNSDAECNFPEYADGHLGTITIPEGKHISLRFEEGSPQWMKLASESSGEYRIIGGWRPNDPEADGRIQKAVIVISDTDGAHSEEYTITRPYFGLPVVQIGGNWWCKYNLRGNVKNFRDQILPGHEPCGDVPLSDYLSSCTDEEFLYVMGDQYQAGNPDGLKLIHNGTSFVYDGYSSTSLNFGTLPPGEMAPPGYEIPDYSDFRFFSWGNNCNLAYFNPGAFNNGLGQRLSFTVIERQAEFLSHSYGAVNHITFTHGENTLTLFGPGHQWDAGNIAPMTVIYATHGHSSNSWNLEGYPQSTGRGNWIKYSAHNSNKTRTIRCIKTPVEYIY